MIKSQRWLRWFGGLGLAAGLVLVLGAPIGGDELAGMLRGYGTMLAGAALYLLAGQWLLHVGRGRRMDSRKGSDPLQQRVTRQA